MNGEAMEETHDETPAARCPACRRQLLPVPT